MILDSGSRSEFSTGAVRDIQKGKGYFHVMPLRVVAEFMNDEVIDKIGLFVEKQDVEYLYQALDFFGKEHYDNDRCSMILDVAKHFEEGAEKYGEFNWQKGLPIECYIDSMCRHYLKYISDFDDEPHDRAFVWNVLCCIWTVTHEVKHE